MCASAKALFGGVGTQLRYTDNAPQSIVARTAVSHNGFAFVEGGREGRFKTFAAKRMVVSFHMVAVPRPLSLKTT